MIVLMKFLVYMKKKRIPNKAMEHEYWKSLKVFFEMNCYRTKLKSEISRYVYGYRTFYFYRIKLENLDASKRKISSRI